MRGASGDDPDGTGESGASDRPDQDDESTHSTAESAESSEKSGDESPGTASDLADGNAGTERSVEDAGATSDAGDADAAEIDTAELTVAERSLHPRIRTIWIARAVLWSLVLGAIAFAATWYSLEITLLAPAALTAVLLVLFVAHAILRFRAWQYEFREDAIYLERGVLTRVRTVVPFVRIQHVDTARGPIDRVAGLSTLVVYTAGSRGADVTIPGIDAERATDYQRRLKQLAIAAEDDTAV